MSRERGEAIRGNGFAADIRRQLEEPLCRRTFERRELVHSAERPQTVFGNMRKEVSVIYHRYTQRELRRSLPSNRLNATGTGKSLNLGNEVDVIVAIQQIRRVDFSVVVGIFVPGAGVATPARAVLYWKPEVRFFF